MKFPYSMLRDFVETELDADAMGDLLTMAGFELEGIEEVEGEPVLDVNIMSNRGDGCSVFGLAREVLAKDAGAKPTELFERAAARFGGGTSSRISSDAPIRLAQGRPSSQVEGGSVTIETEECTRYACLLFEGVENGQAPACIQERLRKAGQRPISVLVDLTNYVMLELGQPLHAFDLDKLAGPAIVVRRARPGEKLTTLNGEEHEVRPDQMMICDAEKPVAAAGIMGGADTEVDANTNRVLLESAHFVNASVRRTRKQLGLSTEASYRFERSVDPEGVVAALERFAELLAQIDGGASRVPGVIDVYPDPATREPIPLDLARTEVLLGMPIQREQAVSYLLRLGFKVEQGPTEFSLSVSPPTWRPDVVRQEDIVEELGRVHGYDRIPEAALEGTTICGGSTGFELWCDAVRDACLRLGFAQTVSYSLRDVGPLDEPGVEGITLRNAISPETAWLRSSNLPCLADNARRNGGRDVHLFELGRVFSKTGGAVSETVRLALLSQGRLNPIDWLDKDPQPGNFFTLKGAIEEIAKASRAEVGFTPGTDPRFHPTKQARVASRAGEPLGILGQIHPDVADAAGIPVDTILAELNLESMYKEHHAAPRLKPLSRNPSVRRDIALLIDESVPFKDIDAALERSIGDVLEKMWLFDVYEGKGIPEGKHSLAIALQLRKHGSTFTDEEANQVREKAVSALANLGGSTR